MKYHFPSRDVEPRRGYVSIYYGISRKEMAYPKE